jgi:hypothetical protein
MVRIFDDCAARTAATGGDGPSSAGSMGQKYPHCSTGDGKPSKALCPIFFVVARSLKRWKNNIGKV